MYDSLTLTTMQPNSLEILSRFDKVNVRFNDKGIESRTAKLETLDLWSNGSILQVRGSLQKYWQDGHNYQRFDYRDASAALVCLSDTLGVPLNEWKVTRLHVGLNLQTQILPDAYFQTLAGHKDLTQTLSGYGANKIFQKGKRRLEFYDKTKEAIRRANAPPVPCNLLRVELKFDDVPKKFLNWQPVTATALYYPRFQNDLLFYYSTYIDNLMLIPDPHKRLIIPSTVKSPTDLLGWLVARNVPLEESLKAIDQCNHLSAKHKSDMRRRVKKEYENNQPAADPAAPNLKELLKAELKTYEV